MKLVKKIKKIFKEIFSNQKLKKHNARHFVEIFETTDLEIANRLVLELKRYKIPVYELKLLKRNNSEQDKLILRVPKPHYTKAMEILNARNE